MTNPFAREIAKLEALRRNLTKLIANEIENEALDNFKKQGFHDTTINSWQQRKNNRDPGRAILVGKASGKLRRGISSRSTATTATVYVDPLTVPYAAVHNEGGRINVTQNVKPFSRTKKGKREAVRAFKRRVNFQMPERRFIGPSKHLEDKINKLIQDELKRALS